ncbi:MAG TPA: hypothetical protein DDW76_35695 [Cyanobacteria bacterium UBA11369]|nr:hypothetical protein [Cyanobacteria bacterium UBA11371]HBE36960.1 hypothetical protein [Cyanobacteria bacterium UBA11368]HBE53954.1 hypothetical protein [Cyanobacteria bacterium UBA11369]
MHPLHKQSDNAFPHKGCKPLYIYPQIDAMFQRNRLKQTLKRWRRRWFELWGSDRYSKPAKSNLEKQ